MKYKLYTFTGITCCDGTTKSISLYDVIKRYDELFLNMHTLPVNPRYETPWYAIPTLTLLEDKVFCLEANEVEMKYIQDWVEKGLTIIPFSRTYFVMDLLSYLEQGLTIAFMTIKDYKQFKKDYADNLMSVEDKTVKGLF